LKIRTDKEIEQSIANVRATLAVENIKMNQFNTKYGKIYLKGKISSEEVIENITKKIKNRMSGH
jgi:hypothetical protein